jgi:hypothetical protein
LPSLIALTGWLMLLATTDRQLLTLILVVYSSGLVVYILRNRFAPRANQI